MNTDLNERLKIKAISKKLVCIKKKKSDLFYSTKDE